MPLTCRLTLVRQLSSALFSGLVSLLLMAAAHAQSGVADDFETGELNWGNWCPCQIKLEEAPITFSKDPDQVGDMFISIVADDASLGGNICRSKSPHFECRPPKGTPEFLVFQSVMGADALDPETTITLDTPEPLGPSFIRPPELEALDKTLRPLTTGSEKNPHCTPEILAKAIAAGEEGECFQRQELRPQNAHLHGMSAPYVYSIRFRMPATIEDKTNSIRWVTAQWKHEPTSKRYEEEFGADWAPSPFLAQRFDDGVLHITVQDENCRCIVASAPGTNYTWQDGRAQHCISTKPGDPPKTACTPDLAVKYGEDPILTSPRGKWVEMTYRVEAGRAGKSHIDITQDGRFIVRVTGKIGYDVDVGQESLTKFKFGAYRDYMPFVHVMDVDSVRFAPE
jgi:hypothetical protein